MRLRTAFTGLAAVSLTATAFSFVLLSPPHKWHTSQLPRNFTI